MIKLGRHELHHGDSLDVLRAMPDASIDAVVTDPPYGLGREPDALAMLRDWLNVGHHEVKGRGFMGHQWDAFVPQPALWAEVLRVLKPGGHAVVFAGTRTQDIMGLALRIAGFEVRDCLAWLYGSGFPKSLDVGKAIDKAAGAEREVIGRHTEGRHATPKHDLRGGAYGNHETKLIDLSAITAPATDAARQWDGWGTALKPAHEPILLCRKRLVGTVAANVQAFGTGAINVDGCRIGTSKCVPSSVSGAPNRIYGAGLGTKFSGLANTGCDPNIGRWPANVVLDDDASELLDAQTGTLSTGAWSGVTTAAKSGGVLGDFAHVGDTGRARAADSGGASRFFYCAKASTSERGPTNKHPTVKPLALMRWLCKLITPPGGLIIDPFAGSGTTLLAADALGFRCIAVEREADHISIIRDRFEGAQQSAPLFAS